MLITIIYIIYEISELAIWYLYQDLSKKFWKPLHVSLQNILLYKKKLISFLLILMLCKM